jgi:pimeloyl-ACP methyl ester carboxylesterase
VPPTDHYIDLPTGIRAHYLTWGDGTHPPIVLNHATGFLARLWDPVAERLAERYTVYAADARGHGDSDKPAPQGDNYHWLRLVEDHQAFLDALGLRDLPFAGHSSGAAVGLYLAGEHPEYYAGLVAVEPIVMPGGFQPDETRREQMAEGARRRRSIFGSVGEVYEQYRSRPTFELWPDNMLRLYAEHGTFLREDGHVQLKCPGEIEGAVFANSASLDVWSALPRIQTPVLVLRGERTEGFLSMVAEQVAARIPKGRLETISGAGHLSPMELPATVADLILDFAP